MDNTTRPDLEPANDLAAVKPSLVGTAAAIAIVVGVGAIIEMITQAIAGTYRLDLAVVGLPIGFGLLRGSPRSRRWAVLFSAGGLVLLGSLLAWLVWQHLGGSPVSEPSPFGSDLAELVPLVVACAFVLRVLSQRETKEWFAQPAATKPRAVIGGGMVAILALYFLTLTALAEWRHREALERVFSFHTRIVAVDEETGERLPSVSLRGPVTGVRQPALPKVNLTFGQREDGAYVSLSGLAEEPYSTTISSYGYEDYTLVIASDTPEVIEIKMRKLKDTRPAATPDE